MEQWIPWIWVILALILAVAEIFTTGFMLICFGLGALAAAGVAWLGFGLPVQAVTFLITSSAAVALVRPLVTRISNRDTYLIGIDRVVGRTALVMETIDPATGRGVVRVGSEPWSARSLDGTPIAAGSQVEIVRVEGTHLLVRLTAARNAGVTSTVGA